MNNAVRHRIESVEIFSQSNIRVTWGDEHRSQFPGIWLLNACSCPRCGQTESAIRYRLLNDIPDEPHIINASLNAQSELIIDWGDNHTSSFNGVWLRAHCLSHAERGRRKLSVSTWDENIRHQLPRFNYKEIKKETDQRKLDGINHGEDDEKLTPAKGLHLQLLETLRDVGFVILNNVPAEREHTQSIASLVGKLRMTNYGIFELMSRPDPEIVGDTALPLNLHTDEPYRRDPPGITLFHVISQSNQGGDSTLADGFRLAEKLRQHHPNAFDILCKTPARFHRTLKEGRAFETQAPIISVDRDNQVTGIRLLDRGMAPVDAPYEEVLPFYQSLKQLLAMVYADDGQITVRLEAGEMLIFNNQRLLHGRKSFDPHGSVRHVRTCHVDLDEFHSRLRTAYLDQGKEAAWMNLGAATKNTI